MNNLYKKAKDIFIQRRTPDGKFEEHPLIVSPNSVIATDGCNNLIMIPTSSFGVGGSSYFLKNQTVNSAETIHTYDSIFNPANLLIVSSSIFIIEASSDYYVLGDLINSGSMVVDGTLKIGGSLFNAGTIVGTGIIQ